jgi:hypothetical protein
VDRGIFGRHALIRSVIRYLLSVLQPISVSLIGHSPAMKHSRTISKLGVRPEQFIFVCPSCKGIDTKEVKRVAARLLAGARLIRP